MIHDSAATKARLLDAALSEFAERGLAGARVDRISATATANKRAIYDYFGSKEQLFDAVVTHRCGALIDSVPFDAADLPGFATGVFDHVVTHPELMRMTLWKRLELPTVDDHEREVYGHLVDQLTATYTFVAGPEAEQRQIAEAILILVFGAATAWSSLAPGALDEGVSNRLQVQRNALAGAVDAMVTALASPTPAAHAGSASAERDVEIPSVTQC